MKKALSAIIGLLVIVASIPAIAQQVSFDRLYPQSLFGQAREHCIRAWGSLDELLYASGRNSRSTILLDAALGQLTFAKSCVKKIDGKKVRLSSEDLIDFSRVVGTVADRSEKLFDNDSPDKITLLKKILFRLRQCCEKIMNQVRDF